MAGVIPGNIPIVPLRTAPLQHAKQVEEVSGPADGWVGSSASAIASVPSATPDTKAAPPVETAPAQAPAPTVLTTIAGGEAPPIQAGLGLGGKTTPTGAIFLEEMPCAIADARSVGLQEVTDLAPAKYASAARSALLSYLPKEDVDSASALKGYLKDPTYQHSLWKTEAGDFHYTSGFAHDLGPQGRAIQLDYHSLLEGTPPDVAGGKLAFERFLKGAGPADYLFVEVTPEMGELYKQIDSRFTEFAPPGGRSAGDAYTLLALPTSPEAAGRLRDSSREVFHAYVDSWCSKNLGDDWKQSQPEALPAYNEMMTAERPVWSQPPLPG